MSNKEEEVQRAKLAEQAERYKIKKNNSNFLNTFFVFLLDMMIWLMP
jgi:hypothetical protein